MAKKKLLIIVASVVLFVGACIGLALFGKKVEKIDVLKKDMPQLIYVQGSDLNLSSGVITAVIGDEKVELSLNNPDVVVTGYDKNKLGEQILTITYEEQTTTIKVTVVPRVVVEKYSTAYFVGEEFNSSVGSLVITNDDGTQFNVNMKDESVSISNFSTETANPSLEVTATYTGDGVSYSGTFNVAVYEIASATFNAPSKKEYQNHETALDVSGGYISLKSADEKLVRHVILSKDMVSGFDLSAATLEHRKTALSQTLTVSYLGIEKEYKIQIKFSDLSLIRLRASECEDFEWETATTPEGCTTEIGDNALEAMSVYFNMEDNEKKDVDPSELEVLVKTAATYGLDKWNAAFKAYEDAFYLKNGSLYWDCTDYEKTKAVYSSLSNKNPVIYEDSLILKNLETNFANVEIIPAEDEYSDPTTVGSILASVYSTEMMDNFAGQIGMMISLYESLTTIPTEWDLDLLKNQYSATIEATWVLLRESDYTHIQYRSLYKMASNWREKQDLFEILYTYYYNTSEVVDGKVDLTKINAFKDFHLTGRLETLYTHLYNAKRQLEQIRSGYAKAEEFMYYYEQALKLKDEILKNGTDMEKDLYGRLEFDYLISNGTTYDLYSFEKLFFLFRYTQMGYLYHFNGYLGVEEFESLWAQNLAILETVTTVGESYYETAEFGAAVEAMFREFMSMTPTEQVVFMNLLNPYYIPVSQPGFPSMVWDDTEVTYNSFVGFVYRYYRSVLPESTHDAFRQLMYAVENFSHIGMSYVMFLDHFKQDMVMVYDYLDALDPADVKAFENTLWFYDYYKTLDQEKFASIDAPQTEKLDNEAKQDFNDLYTALTQAYYIIELNNLYQQNGYSIGIALISAYEKVEDAADKILASDNEAVLKAYYYDVMTKEMNMPNGMPMTFGGTPEFLVYYIRNAYATYMRGSLFTQNYLLYDYYNDIKSVENADGMDLTDFLSKASDMYYTYWYMNYVGSPDADPKFFTDVDLMVEIMSDYRTLSTEQKHFVTALSNQFGMYAGSIMQFAVEQKLSNEAFMVVQDLLTVEFYYAFYEMYPEGTSEDEESPYATLLGDALAVLLEDYAVLIKDATAKGEFDKFFADMYAYYIDKCAAAGFDTTLPEDEPTTEAQ